MVHAVLAAPGGVPGSPTALAHRNRRVLMERDRPVRLRRLIEEESPNRKDIAAQAPRNSFVAEEVRGEDADGLVIESVPMADSTAPSWEAVEERITLGLADDPFYDLESARFHNALSASLTRMSASAAATRDLSQVVDPSPTTPGLLGSCTRMSFSLAFHGAPLPAASGVTRSKP